MAHRRMTGSAAHSTGDPRDVRHHQRSVLLTVSHPVSRRSCHSRATSPESKAITPGHGVLTASFATRGSRVQIPSAPLIRLVLVEEMPEPDLGPPSGFGLMRHTPRHRCATELTPKSTSFDARRFLTQSHINQPPRPSLPRLPWDHAGARTSTSHRKRRSTGPTSGGRRDPISISLEGLAACRQRGAIRASWS
jgi:hypothetical protein